MPTDNLKLSDIIRNAKGQKIIIYPPTIDWNLPLIQRPQHLASHLARQGFLYLYCTTNTYDHVKGFEIIEPNLILTDQFNQITNTLSSGWIVFHAAHPYFSLDHLLTWKKRGFKIIYEYLDQIDSKLIPDPAVLRLVLLRHRSITNDLIDLAVVTSVKLVEELNKRIDNHKIIYVPNGVDYDHFQNNQEIKNCPGDLLPIVTQKNRLLAITEHLLNGSIIPCLFQLPFRILSGILSSLAGISTVHFDG